MISQIVSGVLSFYSILIFAYVIMSWFPIGRDGILADAHRVLSSVCEPYIGIFRRIVPSAGAFDFSPLVALLVLNFLIQPLAIQLLRTAGL